MDNDTYDDRHARQTKVNKNLISRIQELEDKTANPVNDQIDIKLMKQEEFIVKKIQVLDDKDYKQQRFYKQCSGLADVVAKLDHKIVKLEGQNKVILYVELLI